MKQACTLCERMTIDGNLWCPEPDCPVGKMPQLLSYGEPFGELEIVKHMVVLRSSALYEAVRDGQQVILKIAHDGYHERLKRESEFLMQLQGKGLSHPVLPHILAAHQETDFAYGKVTFQGRRKYYSIFEHTDGDLLREILLKNPQPWFQHVNWIALALADVISLLHEQQRLHLALCPECILVRYDQDNVPRIKLLDLGAVTTPQNVSLQWHPSFTPTAYTARELMQNRPLADKWSDVYGIGLILYEMLAGFPAYEYRLRSEEAVRQAVLRGQPDILARSDLSKLPSIAQKAIHPEPGKRQQNTVQLASELLASSKPLPPEKKGRKLDWRAFALMMAAAIIITIILATAVVLAG